MSITDLGADAATESSGNQSDGSTDNDWSRFDLDGCSFGRMHPTTAVRGTMVALRDLYDEEDRDRPDVAVILDDPEIVTSEASLEDSVVVQSEEEGDQFKVVNESDDQTKVLEGMGIDFAGNTFYGDIQDDFGEMDRIALKRGGGAGRRISKTLDANGATAAEAQIEREEDGTIESMALDDDGFPAHNGGLIEYDNEGDEMPRYSRATKVRPDVAGREVVIMIQRLAEIDPDYDGPSYWATVFGNLSEDQTEEITEQYADGSERDPEDFMTELGGTEFVQLSPTDEFDPSEALVDATGYIAWDGIDREDADEVLALNTARLEQGHGSVYIPEGQAPDDVVPDSVDNLELDPGEDDWGDESDTTPAFGAGASA